MTVVYLIALFSITESSLNGKPPLNHQVNIELVHYTFAEKRKHQLRQFQSKELWKVSHISRCK